MADQYPTGQPSKMDMWDTLKAGGEHLLSTPMKLLSAEGLTASGGFAIINYVDTAILRTPIQQALIGLPMPQVTLALYNGAVTSANFIYAGCLGLHQK